MNNNRDWRDEREEEYLRGIQSQRKGTGRNGRQKRHLTVVGMTQLAIFLCVIAFGFYAWLVGSGIIHVQGWQ